MKELLLKIKFILLHLTTQKIVDTLNFLNPHVFITDWRLMAIFSLIIIFLLSMRMVKTITFLLGSIVLWIVGYYYLPKIETGIELTNMVIIIVTSIIVVGVWIYVFFIRE